jgi:hypothetical protein
MPELTGFVGCGVTGTLPVGVFDGIVTIGAAPVTVFVRGANASFGGGGGATRPVSFFEAGAVGTPELIGCLPLSAGRRDGMTAPGSVLSFFGICTVGA